MITPLEPPIASPVAAASPMASQQDCRLEAVEKAQAAQCFGVDQWYAHRPGHADRPGDPDRPM
jgi:hypothetical protein